MKKTNSHRLPDCVVAHSIEGKTPQSSKHIARVPEVTYRGVSVECESGEILRTVLRNNAMSPHSGMTEIVNF